MWNAPKPKNRMKEFNTLTKWLWNIINYNIFKIEEEDDQQKSSGGNLQG